MAASRRALTKVLAAASVAMAALLVSSPMVNAAPQRGEDVWKNSAESWALGLVVPNGAELADGTQLSWADVRNVTVLTRLPNITEPQGITYLILSAEGNDGAVVQVAAGVWPRCGEWWIYSWHIIGLGTGSITYRWVANRSAPSVAPGDLVSLSITISAGAWGMKAQNLNTSESKAWSVPSPTLNRFAAGDQEVMALESYTTSASTFKEMGNATLLGLLVDGVRVAGGWYTYGGWEPDRSPMFAVGSASPPTFVSLNPREDGRATWSYDAQWTGAIWNVNAGPMIYAYAALAALVPIALLLVRRLGRWEGRG